MYRLQIIIKIEQGASFSKVKAFLKQELAGLQKGKGFGGFRMICDVDPLRGREDRGRRAAAVVKMMVDKVKLVAYNKKKAETDE